jgi:hypothetical protein
LIGAGILLVGGWLLSLVDASVVLWVVFVVAALSLVLGSSSDGSSMIDLTFPPIRPICWEKRCSPFETMRPDASGFRSMI